MNSRVAPQRHILVVDDESLVLETVQMLLRFDGHRAAGANDAAQALALFEPGKFDLVFTDYFMPAMNGAELAAAIKKRSPGQIIVMLTAFPEKLQGPGRVAPNVDLLMTKPFEIGDLREAVARCNVPNLEFSI
jgi:CheY-like chemotaxis protein